MLVHPNFDPAALRLHVAGHEFAIHWYGLMYMLAFILFLLLGRYRIKKGASFSREAQDDLLFFGVLGVVLGGRLGYILFYKLGHYLEHPWEILKVWEGGMSFHGGFLGVLVALALFARRQKKSWLEVTDIVAPLVPTGLLVGRFGNFINGELWGRVTRADAPWAVLFPQAHKADLDAVAADPGLQGVFSQFQGLPRHASQLYEMMLEGLLLFVLLWCFTLKPRARGAASGLFLIGYGSFRFIVEFAREPDNFLGLQALGLSRGQWLCVPMILAGIGLMLWAYRQPRKE